MRILVISQYFYPETFRINDIVKELVKRGHIVTVLTGLPNYPEGLIFDGYKEAYRRIEDYYGAAVYRCKLRPRKKGSLNLVFNYISFVRQAKKTLKHIKPNFDIIYFYELSPISSGIPAIWYGKKHHIKTAIYNLDIWPESVRDLRDSKIMSKKNPIYLLAKTISRYVYKRFDLIINKCDEFAEYLTKNFHIAKSKMLTLYEHAEQNYLLINQTPLDNGILDFMFLGNIGHASNCKMIIQAFSKIKGNDYAVHFVGGGSELISLKKMTNDFGLQGKVYFHGRVSQNEVIDYYNFCDVCLLTLTGSSEVGLTPPAKLASYLASGRPIIASINGPGKRIVEESGCGFACDADDVETFARIIQKVIDDRSLLDGLGAKGRLFYLQNLTISKHIDSLEIALNNGIKSL